MQAVKERRQNKTMKYLNTLVIFICTQFFSVPFGEWEKNPCLQAKTSGRLLSEKGSRIQGAKGSSAVKTSQ
jgi:hypothetical protein